MGAIPTQEQIDHSITSDLMKKISNDITGYMVRTLSLAGERQQLPIGIAGGAACAGVIAAMLNKAGGGEGGKRPDPECILLAGLLLAHTGIGGDDPIGNAYRDLERLKAAGAQP